MDAEHTGSSTDSDRSRLNASSAADHDSSSSATSPSGSEPQPSPRSHRKGEATISKDATEFLSDLSNYLPLGCLCFEDLTQQDEELDDSTWFEITHLPPLMVFDETLYSHVQKLAVAGWIRTFSMRSRADPRFLVFRVYILPFDVGLRYLERDNKRLSPALEGLLADIEVSPEAWRGEYSPKTACKFDMWATCDLGSLFWLFNNIPSPSPSLDLLDEKYAHEALEDLLDPSSVLPGLKTQLYPYQRRSAGLMLQRESVSSLQLDPSLERRIAPDGSVYYYGPRDLSILRHPRFYEACRGGILAETMGLGKTVICLALIVATKDQLPKIPTPYALPLVRRSVGSLAEMAISSINRHSIPWKVEFKRVLLATGNEMESCRRKLDETAPTYEIPMQPIRWNRKTVQPPPKKMILASTTVIVVPRNLCKQWQSEIQKHVDVDLLRILLMDSSKSSLPPAEEIRTYDIIFFTRGRFEAEIRDGSDEQGRRLGSTQRLCSCPYIGATRTRDCHCIRTDELYESPLKHVHFKRLIIDEGHFFSNTNNTAVAVADKLIMADSRWVVSGTPAKDLLGVEVDMSSAEYSWHAPDAKDPRQAVLEHRRHFSSKEDTSGAIRSLGSLATNFLKIKPWAASGTDKGLVWDEHIYRHEDFRKRTFSGFSTCLRQVLKAMVVKTQPEDVERDILLPPLTHKVVRLKPSFYDKLTANLFTLVLTANAITSERTDVDYLFHKNSQKARSQLIANLRQSAFFWTAFSEADVQASVKSSNGYLSKEGTNCSESDRALLTETLRFVDTVLNSKGWKALSRSHELGVFVDDWPSDSADHWAFDKSQMSLLTGISQLLEAQKHVNERIVQEDPGEGLAGAGIRAVAPAKDQAVKKEEGATSKEAEKPILTKSGIPTSSIDGEPSLRRRSFGGSKASPQKITKSFKVVKPHKKQRDRSGIAELANAASNSPAKVPDTVPSPSSATTPVRDVTHHNVSLPADSPFAKSRIVGTTSAKLSYLISQILKYYEHEKILIFYDGENAAWYIAQMLELLHIKHEIYAKSLAAHLKSEYVVRFDQEVQDRVLLMDVRTAAYGLNIPSASRIYFVNPTCRPNIEAQAIKRAHRIGQTRPVYVETLVLEGTIEEKMLERSKRMTVSEHRDAGHLEDDVGIREVIQSARMVPVTGVELEPRHQIAFLETSQQLWGRPGRNVLLGTNDVGKTASTKKRKRADSTDERQEHSINRQDVTDRSVVRRTLAFVGVDAQKESGDESVRRTYEQSVMGSPSSYQRPFGMVGLQDPSMPSMFGGHTRPACALQPQSSSSDLHHSSRSDLHQKLSAAQLLDHGHSPATTARYEENELLQMILGRL